MKFCADHTFEGVSVERYEDLYFEEDFNEALCVAVRLTRDQEFIEDAGDVVKRAVKVGPDREIPPAMQKALGGKRIEYTEHLTYHRPSRTGTWTTVPSLMANKVDVGGTFRFEAVGENRVRRVFEGEIKVKVFGVGGMVEKLIIGDIQRSFDKAAVFTQQWLNEGR